MAPMRRRPLLPARIAFFIVLAVLLAVASGLVGVVLGVESFVRGVVSFFVLGAVMLPLWRWLDRRGRSEQ